MTHKNPVRFNNWLTTAKERLLFIDASILETPIMQGFDKIEGLKDHRLEKLVLKELKSGSVVYKPQPWRFWVCNVICENGDISTDEALCFPEEELVSDDVKKIGMQMMQRMRESYSDDIEVIGFAYALVCSDNHDIDKTSQRVIATLLKNGLAERDMQVPSYRRK